MSRVRRWTAFGAAPVVVGVQACLATTPAVFLNGMRQIITEYDWDEFLPVESVETMEVYMSTSAPLQYRSENGSCGSVLIWTRTEIR